MSTLINMLMRKKGHSDDWSFWHVTSASDLMKPLYRLPLPGDYLSKARLVSVPL